MKSTKTILISAVLLGAPLSMHASEQRTDNIYMYTSGPFATEQSSTADSNIDVTISEMYRYKKKGKEIAALLERYEGNKGNVETAK